MTQQHDNTSFSNIDLFPLLKSNEPSCLKQKYPFISGQMYLLDLLLLLFEKISGQTKEKKKYIDLLIDILDLNFDTFNKPLDMKHKSIFDKCCQKYKRENLTSYSEQQFNNYNETKMLVEFKYKHIKTFNSSVLLMKQHKDLMNELLLAYKNSDEVDTILNTINNAIKKSNDEINRKISELDKDDDKTFLMKQLINIDIKDEYNKYINLKKSIDELKNKERTKVMEIKLKNLEKEVLIFNEIAILMNNPLLYNDFLKSMETKHFYHLISDIVIPLLPKLENTERKPLIRKLLKFLGKYVETHIVDFTIKMNMFYLCSGIGVDNILPYLNMNSDENRDNVYNKLYEYCISLGNVYFPRDVLKDFLDRKKQEDINYEKNLCLKYGNFNRLVSICNGEEKIIELNPFELSHYYINNLSSIDYKRFFLDGWMLIEKSASDENYVEYFSNLHEIIYSKISKTFPINLCKSIFQWKIKVFEELYKKKIFPVYSSFYDVGYEIILEKNNEYQFLLLIALNLPIYTSTLKRIIIDNKISSFPLLSFLYNKKITILNNNNLDESLDEGNRGYLIGSSKYKGVKENNLMYYVVNYINDMDLMEMLLKEKNIIDVDCICEYRNIIKMRIEKEDNFMFLNDLLNKF